MDDGISRWAIVNDQARHNYANEWKWRKWKSSSVIFLALNNWTFHERFGRFMKTIVPPSVRSGLKLRDNMASLSNIRLPRKHWDNMTTISLVCVHIGTKPVFLTSDCHVNIGTTWSDFLRSDCRVICETTWSDFEVWLLCDIRTSWPRYERCEPVPLAGGEESNELNNELVCVHVR